MVVGPIPCKHRLLKCQAGPKENLTREAVVEEVIKEVGVEEEEVAIKEVVVEEEDIKGVEVIEVIKEGEVETIMVVGEVVVEITMEEEGVETIMEMEVDTREGVAVDATHTVVEEVEGVVVGVEEEVDVYKALGGAEGVGEGAIVEEVIRKAFLLNYTYIYRY